LPLVKREIVYRLLQGNQGARLRQIASLSGYSDGISSAIETLRDGFDKPLRMDGIASEFGMSLSSFYSRFKAVTAMSPLQFQKQLRLQEARRLLLNGDLDAASVGYDDASQFSREYKRFFGSPPMSDVREMKASGAAYNGPDREYVGGGLTSGVDWAHIDRQPTSEPARCGRQAALPALADLVVQPQTQAHDANRQPREDGGRAVLRVHRPCQAPLPMPVKRINANSLRGTRPGCRWTDRAARTQSKHGSSGNVGLSCTRLDD